MRDSKGPRLLYDNVKDPLQLDNHAGKPEHAKLQTEQETRLEQKLAEQRDEFLPGADYLAKWGYKVNASGTARY